MCTDNPSIWAAEAFRIVVAFQASIIMLSMTVFRHQIPPPPDQNYNFKVSVPFVKLHGQWIRTLDATFALFARASV